MISIQLISQTSLDGYSMLFEMNSIDYFSYQEYVLTS